MTFYSQDTNGHFRETQEILRERKLRLNVNTDGQGYIVFLEDAADKTGFASVSDESGIIRLCKFLQ